MKFEDLKCISDNVNLDDYYNLYDYVKENMEHTEWLGYIPRDEVIDILNDGGKIWLYYDNDLTVCSIMYIPTNEETLQKHNVTNDYKVTGCLGPIMVNPNYIGNGFMLKMMDVFNKYNMDIGNKFIFTKAATDNIYSCRNMEKDGYVLCDQYSNERGLNNAYIKKL